MRRRVHIAIAAVLAAAAVALVAWGPDPAPPASAEAGVARPGYALVPPGTLTAETLAGARVYGPDGGRIGDVEDVVIDPGGLVEGAIVVSGGICGIGAHRVAVPLDSLSIEQAQEGGEVRVFSRLTASDIAAMPAYP